MTDEELRAYVMDDAAAGEAFYDLLQDMITKRGMVPEAVMSGAHGALINYMIHRLGGEAVAKSCDSAADFARRKAAPDPYGLANMPVEGRG
ncbi:hypothetical protein [uncultured Paracoccus sp.]|uniref:hypothetical protein n=1 Tax=uncultured Paracoccus sp. TaxID=189685 RepID=UPI002600D841|nr:hypothetical protein [uncultured Paracoccus sp.]